MRYTLLAGRVIHKDGKPFLIIKRDTGGDHDENGHYVSPTEVDDTTRFLVHLLNTYDEGMLKLSDTGEPT